MPFFSHQMNAVLRHQLMILDLSSTAIFLFETCMLKSFVEISVNSACTIICLTKRKKDVNLIYFQTESFSNTYRMLLKRKKVSH